MGERTSDEEVGKGWWTMSSEFLPDPQYKFVSGNGDFEHESRLTDAAAKGYRVKMITHNPGGVASNQELVVLMAKEAEPKRKE
jgi:hypothetical protein